MPPGAGDHLGDRARLLLRGPRHEDGAGGAFDKRRGDLADLSWSLSGPEHRLGLAGAKLAMVVDDGVGDRLSGKVAQRVEGLVGGGGSRGHAVEQLGQVPFVHERRHCILRHSTALLTAGFESAAPMTLSSQTLTVLVLVSLGLNLLLGVLLAVGMAGRKRDVGPIHMDDVVRGVLDGQGRSMARLEAAIRQLSSEGRRQAGLISEAVRHVGLVRYDAFEDVGGRLSFSCALLDDRGSGVVMTSINGRQDTRVYAKPIAEGRSSYNLSSEEEDAIRQALSEPREAVHST